MSGHETGDLEELLDNVRTKEVFINFVAGYTFNYFSLLLAEFSKGKSTFGATVRPSEQCSRFTGI